MEKLESYMTEMVSDEERLENLLAVSAGIQTGLNYMFKRLSSYHALLELELDESPAGRIYLQEGDIALRVAFGLLKKFQQILQSGKREFESIDLKVLINGVVSRLKRIGQCEITVDFGKMENQETFVGGHLFLLQQVFFELPHLFHGKEQPEKADRLFLRGRIQKFDDAFFKSCKSELGSGEYILVTLSREDREFDNAGFVGLFEKQVISPKLELVDSLIFFYGTVLMHGGDILCLKKEDDLRSIALLFPLLRNTIDMFEEKTVQEEALKGSETILLVDDEGIIWDVVIDMLQGLGYTVVLAANGRECVEVYEKNPGQIDLVLLDMVMPEMNGHDAFFALKDIDKDVKVLLSSGYVEEDDARDVLDAGACGFLRKPYRMVDLAKKIRSVVDS